MKSSDAWFRTETDCTCREKHCYELRSSPSQTVFFPVEKKIIIVTSNTRTPSKQILTEKYNAAWQKQDLTCTVTTASIIWLCTWGSFKTIILTSSDSKYGYIDETLSTVSNPLDQKRDSHLCSWLGGAHVHPVSYALLSEAACYWNQHPYSPVHCLHFDCVACRLTRWAICWKRSFFFFFSFAKILCLEFKTLFSQMGDRELSKLAPDFILRWHLLSALKS